MKEAECAEQTQCSKCREPGIIKQEYSGNILCHSHLIVGVEAKAKRMIRAHNWLSSQDSVVVALSGGEASTAVLLFLHKLFSCRKDITLCAIHVDEGIASFHRKEKAISIADQIGIPCILASFTEAYGTTVDMYATLGKDVCAWCEEKRHLLLHQIAQEHGFTKIAYGYHLEDFSTAVLSHIVCGDPSLLLEGDRRIDATHIAPFCMIPKKEVVLYSGMESSPKCPHAKHNMKNQIAKLLDQYANRHPSVHHAIVGLSDRISSKNS
ncbi:MAG: tRNA(Ile)-lysidine synthase [Methanomicrobiales archaeon]|jgi:tRNA(Ile)-lysidine synthase TilS/MesJ|nr:tRNA(Ile)-lysidine synthase [Methanomicrobiales archaeon]